MRYVTKTEDSGTVVVRWREDRPHRLSVDEALERSQASAHRADGWIRSMNSPEPPSKGSVEGLSCFDKQR